MPGFYRNIIAAHGALSSLRPWGVRDIDNTIFGTSSFPEKKMSAYANKRRRSDVGFLYNPTASTTNMGTQTYHRLATRGTQTKGIIGLVRNGKVYFKKAPVRRKSKRSYIRGKAKNTGRKRRTSRKTYRRKSAKKSSTNSWGVFQKKGVLNTGEVGISTTGVTDAVFLGHATFRPTVLTANFFRALIKMLYAKIGFQIDSYDSSYGINTGDVIVVYGKKNLAAATAESTFQYTITVGDTFDVIAAGLATAYASWIGANKEWAASNVLTKIILALPTTPSVCQSFLLLTGAKVTVKYESHLKLQNQTVSASGTEADEVDRIPLQYRRYSGWGTGPISNRISQTEDQIVADGSTGVIKNVGTVASGLSEAPPKSYFKGCKTTYKGVVAPGSFLESKLYFNKTMMLSTFLQQISAQVPVNSTTNVQWHPNGKWSMFHFEHLIKPKSTSPNAIVNGELNNRMGIYCTLHNKFSTDEQVDTAAYVTY